MKLHHFFLALALALTSCSTGYSLTIVWVNTAGGNWNDPANWSPSQVPLVGDDAVITNNGSYTVTLDISPTVDSLVLGGGSGKQTLATAGYTLTLNNPGSVVNHNGVLLWAGGALYGNLNVATNGMIIAMGAGTYDDIHGVVTNAGIFQLTNATLLRPYGDTGGGQLINLPGGVVDLQDDSFIYYAGYASEAVFNQGTVRKSGGSVSSPIYPAFYNSGTVDVQNGLLDVYGGGEGSGLFVTEAGATLAFNSGNYTLDSGAVMTGAGTNLLQTGTFTLNGNVTSSNALLGGATLAGTNGFLAGKWTWIGGAMASGSTLTLATNGVLLMTGGGYHDIHGVLTNAGTMLLTNTSYLRLFGDTGGGQLINLPGGVVDFQDDSFIYYAGYASEAVFNQGTVRKSGGTGISSIYPAFYNSGTLDVQTGTVEMIGNGDGNGRFEADTGATLAFYGTYSIDAGAMMTGAGTNVIAGGIFTLNSGVTGSNLVFAGGTLGGNSVIGCPLTWIGGTIGSGTTVKIATNGVLLLTGGGYHDIHGVLTNAGTMQLTNGSYLRPFGDTGGGQLINLPGALVDFQDDSYIYYSGYASEAVFNQGTVRKSGGTNTTTIYPAFYNSGTLDAQMGTISFPIANYDLTGGRLNFGLNSPTNFGQISLASAATLTGTLSANLNNGYVPIRGDSFAVLNYPSQTGSFGNFILPAREAWSTNYGATTFTLTVLNSAPALPAQSNQVMNEETLLTIINTATDLDLPPDTLSYTFLAAPAGANLSAAGVITWTPDESQGPGTNTFTTRVFDNGSPSLSATNSFQVVVNEVNVAPVLTVPANTNINELATLTVTNTATDHDVPANPLTFSLVSPLAGMAINATNGVFTWTPTEAQGPSTNTITVVVTDTNVFAVNAKSLSMTNSFTVVVNEVNVVPQLTVPADQTINELTLYTNNATATDLDIPANTLTFALVSGPTNMTVSPSGAISWTPLESQGPSTNLVKISVTDFNPWAVNAQHLSVTNSFTITVNEVNTAPVLGALSDWTVNPGQTIGFSATATDADLPTNTLTFALIAPPAGASLDSTSGLFNWRPTVAQANTTNTVQVQVTDFNPWAVNSQHLSDAKSFKVVVKPLAPVVLTPMGYASGQFKFQVSGTTGPDYIIASSTNLSVWSDIFTNLSPTMPFQFTNTVTLTNRFFRARLSP